MLVVITLVGGCDNRTVIVPPEESGILPPENPTKVVIEPQKAEVILAGQQPWLRKQALPLTRWYAQYLNANTIGFTEFTINAAETQTNLFHLTKRDVLEVASTSGGQIRRREIVHDSLEREDGKLFSYTEDSNVDGSVSETVARIEREMLTITKTADGKTTSKSLPWPAGTWGPLGTIAILQVRPMQPGEFREAMIFVPQLEKVVKVELKSKKVEPTPLPGGVSKELLLVETRFIVDGESVLTKNWVNEAGEIIKSVSRGGYTMFQTTREEAERIDGSIRAAQLIDTKLPVQATVEQLRASKVTFSIDSANVDPFGLLSGKVNQQITSLSSLGATVTVHRVIPSAPVPEGGAQDPPEEACLAKFEPEAIHVQKFLSEFPNTSEDALATASTLTAGVFRKLEKAPLSRRVCMPDHALKEGKGDCVAHAILLLAALRERGIPARVASGLRILKEKDSTQLSAIYHMWCEAWVGDRWMPLDPFAGTIGVGADHIKFSESSLHDKSPMNMMLEVLQNMKQFTIAVKPQ
ncbi:MAG: transglutaminase domain-containing protein [Pirellulaceae bacterium]|nr:transglutaminase domain-containing protein [Pirellulaceae bacterium]